MLFRSCRSVFLVLVLLLTAGAPARRPFLWKVQSDSGTVYLFGSIHAAKPEMYPLDPRVYQAFDAADKLVLEADISGEKIFALAGQMMARAMYPPEDSLAKHLRPATYARAQTELTKLGLPFDQFKPWFLAMMLEAVTLESSGLSMQHGMELHFLARAQGGKPILELEGAEAQIALLDNLTDEQQDVFLLRTIDSLETVAESLEKLLAAWTAGDDKALAAFLEESLQDTPAFGPVYRKLLDDRNQRMAAKIAEYLATDQTYFVVVGAGHLVGEHGLLRLLAQRYKINQL